MKIYSPDSFYNLCTKFENSNNLSLLKDMIATIDDKSKVQAIYALMDATMYFDINTIDKITDKVKLVMDNTILPNWINPSYEYIESVEKMEYDEKINEIGSILSYTVHSNSLMRRIDQEKTDVLEKMLKNNSDILRKLYEPVVRI